MFQKSQVVTSSTLLPAPFNWVTIPGGLVTLTHRGGYIVRPVTVTVEPFALAQYPITNAQYQVFVDAPDGYAESRWWDYSRSAQEWRNENPQSSSMTFGGADCPRTHVTWYEAVAFCAWLSTRSGESIRLPDEAEWQRAAQGDDGREYPWGDEWDTDCCHHNAAANQIGTIPVTTYAGRGDSPFGVADMAGNAWEWCTTSWETGLSDLSAEDVRVLRGGSWFDGVISTFRTTYRGNWNPDMTSDLRGFRIARNL
ncbi:MAG: SUMF1/EgtB/PvdO family nonheme iron enzyme [Anaerolineaceae bacterium]|nr:SUMF1/EgtB/PvdO family nonheme iron enzyme [Anaerolineaceae bacterium]